MWLSLCGRTHTHIHANMFACFHMQNNLGDFVTDLENYARVLTQANKNLLVLVERTEMVMEQQTIFAADRLTDEKQKAKNHALLKGTRNQARKKVSQKGAASSADKASHTADVCGICYPIATTTSVK